MKDFKILLIIGLIACSFLGQAQSLSEKFPNKYGVTHHFIEENKIEMMKDAQFAIDNIRKYKNRRNLGYGIVAVGVGTLYYATSHMDVPVSYSNRFEQNVYNKKRFNRILVGSVGVAVAGFGTYLVIKNNKILSKVVIRLQPNSGGVRFYF